jgi:DNA-binding response OmpR family regulator
VLRRTEAGTRETKDARIEAGEVVVDVARRRVTVNKKPVHLPLKQFELLRTLTSHQNKVLTREQLLQTVWNTDASFDTGTLDVHIRWLREKIEEDPSRPKYIKTVRGVGYKFVTDPDEWLD